MMCTVVYNVCSFSLKQSYKIVQDHHGYICQFVCSLLVWCIAGVPLIDGGTVRLPALIGVSRALDMILTGRPVSAQEALSMGTRGVVNESRSLYLLYINKITISYYRICNYNYRQKQIGREQPSV